MVCQILQPWHMLCGPLDSGGVPFTRYSPEDAEMLRKLGLVAACLFLALPVLF